VEHRQIVERVRPARRVLVVDDNASFRCARALLESESFDVVAETATCAAESELVLLDIQLLRIDASPSPGGCFMDDPQLKIVPPSSRDRSGYGAKIEQGGACAFPAEADPDGDSLARLLE